MFVDFLGWPFKKLEGKKERGREWGERERFLFSLRDLCRYATQGYIFACVYVYGVCVCVFTHVLPSVCA